MSPFTVALLESEFFISNLCGLFLMIYCYDLIFLLIAIIMDSNVFTIMSIPLLSKYAIFHSCVVMLTPPTKCFQDVGKFLYSNFTTHISIIILMS